MYTTYVYSQKYSAHLSINTINQINEFQSDNVRWISILYSKWHWAVQNSRIIWNCYSFYHRFLLFYLLITAFIVIINYFMGFALFNNSKCVEWIRNRRKWIWLHDCSVTPPPPAPSLYLSLSLSLTHTCLHRHNMLRIDSQMNIRSRTLGRGKRGERGWRRMHIFRSPSSLDT